MLFFLECIDLFGSAPCPYGGIGGAAGGGMDLTYEIDSGLIIQAMICVEPHLTKAWELDSPSSNVY